MEIKDIIPHHTLAEYVKCFRVVHICPTNNFSSFSKFYVPKPEMVLHSIVKGAQNIQPQAETSTVFNLQCFLSGQQIQPFLFSGKGEILNFQIVFKPTAIFKLTGIPNSEFANKFIEAQLIFGNPIKTFLDQLAHASSSNAMVTIGESFVYGLMLKSKIQNLKLDGLFKSNLLELSQMPVQTLAKENHLSEKQFKRTFIEKIGVNPKMYLNILRFHKAYNIKNANPDWDWLRIAIESGYYDYQHLSKEYLLFTNHTPVQYHQQVEPKSPEMLLGVAKQLYEQRFKNLVKLS